MDVITTKAKILLLFANAYDMLDERKNQITGCSVHYLFWGEAGESLLAQSEYDTSKPVGVQRAKVSLDKSMRNKITVAPALYEGTFAMSVGSDGKPVLKLQDVAYISNIEIKPKVIPGLVVPGMVQPHAVSEETHAAEEKASKAGK